MVKPERHFGPVSGLTLGSGILVTVGVLAVFAWSFWLGSLIAVVGLVAYGFIRVKWY